MAIAEMKTYWFYYGERLVGHGRGENVLQGLQQAIRSAELIDQTNLPYLTGGLFGRLKVKTY